MEPQVEYSVLLRLREGDTKAFEVVFHAYYKYIHAFVLNTLFDKIYAKDITQTVFLTLWEHRKEIDPKRNVGNLLYTMAKNRVYRQTERLLLQDKYKDYVLNSEVEAVTIEDEVNDHILKKLVYKMAEELPPARKRVFMLSCRMGFSNKEIAERLLISEKTVETQIRRSMIFLKDRLKYYYIFLFLFINI